jgi:predicted CXXCH cytochrome family protein
MKKPIFILFILMSCFLVFYGNGYAMVSGPCSNCHTMHYSQNGTQLSEWGSAGPYNTLLINDCLGCHSHGTFSTYYTLDGCNYPVVLFTGGEPGTYLAGGNFWWVKEGLGGDDTKGHNVFLGEPDDNLSGAPGDVTSGPYQTCNNPTCCHQSLSNTRTTGGDFTFPRQGCTKCHMVGSDPPQGYHHLNDNGVPKIVDSAAQGWYRFLDGHRPTGQGYGVAGIEDDDWQANPTSSDHNEYLGKAVDKTSVGGFGNIDENTMTAYCTGCHGVFHQQDTTAVGSSPWLRHPSDAVIPNSGEYAGAFGGTYDPQVPVARDDLSGGVSSTVTLDDDMVMCLSCHRPHGSPYPDMLRFDYDDMIAGSGNTGGCFQCHTQKN